MTSGNTLNCGACFVLTGVAGARIADYTSVYPHRRLRWSTMKSWSSRWSIRTRRDRSYIGLWNGEPARKKNVAGAGKKFNEWLDSKGRSSETSRPRRPSMRFFASSRNPLENDASFFIPQWCSDWLRIFKVDPLRFRSYKLFWRLDETWELFKVSWIN